MSKARNSNKEGKKKALLTQKEKRNAKKEKKDAKSKSISEL
jgi:hypothetical protein